MARKTERYTVVTGASSGIGYETARAFAARGKNLIVAARRKHNLEALKSEILARYPTLACHRARKFRKIEKFSYHYFWFRWSWGSCC